MKAVSPYEGGSLTALVKKIRRLEQYAEWKMRVHLRDRCTCQQCGARNGRKRIIEAHHIIELNQLVRQFGVTSVKGAEDCFGLWDINNGQTLCHSCHEKTESYPKNFIRKTKLKRKANQHKTH